MLPLTVLLLATLVAVPLEEDCCLGQMILPQENFLAQAMAKGAWEFWEARERLRFFAQTTRRVCSRFSCYWVSAAPPPFRLNPRSLTRQA